MNVQITFRPSGRRVQVGQGTSLLQAARKAGVYIPTRCDGKAACLMCKVQISPEWAEFADQPRDAEQRKLGLYWMKECAYPARHVSKAIWR